MPVETEKPSGSPLPGISVSQAFGLPQKFDFATELSGFRKSPGTDAQPSVPVEKAAGTPDPDAMEKGNEAAGAGQEKPADESVEADQKEAAEAAERNAQREAAARGEKPAPKPAKPAEAPAKPTEKKPAAAAAPAAKPAAKPAAAPAKPAAAAAAKPAETPVEPPSAPAKIKVGDKEYTQEELQALLAAKPAAAAPAKPKEEPAPETPEAKAQREQEEAQRETTWIAETAKAMKPSALTESDVDVILTGGKEAVEKMQQIRANDMATVLLHMRRDINDRFRPLIQQVTEISQQREQQEEQRIQSEIFAEHPYLEPHADLLRETAWALVKNAPEEVAKMTEAEYRTKVAELTINFIRKYNPGFGAEAAAPAAAAPAAGTKPAAPAAAPAKPAAAAPAKRQTPPPPGSNSPGGQPTSGGRGGVSQEFQKSAVASLM